MVKKFLKNNLLPLGIFVCYVAVFILLNASSTETNLDNIWNFHNIQKISEGYIPYKEINILITPLFHYIGVFFLKVFGENFMSFYVYGGFINGIVALLMYKIMKKFTKRKGLIVLGISGVILCERVLFIPNYNMLMFVWAFALILLEWKKEELGPNEKKRNNLLDYVLGIVMALFVLTKQTVGGVFSVFFMIYTLIYDKVKCNKINWKSVLRKIMGAIATMVPFFTYLLATGSFIDFLDLCFGGIFDFASKNTAGSFFTWHEMIVVIASYFCFLLYKFKKDKKALLLGIFTISSICVIIPLINDYHMYLSMLVAVIDIVYAIEVILEALNSDKIKLFMERIFAIFGAALILLIMVR